MLSDANYHPISKMMMMNKEKTTATTSGVATLSHQICLQCFKTPMIIFLEV
jgi:ribosomal protein L32